MKRTGIPPLLWTLALVLVAAVLLTMFGQVENRAEPSPSSTQPGGAAVLAELLKESGFQVTSDDLPAPKPMPGDTLVAFVPNDDSLDEQLLDPEKLVGKGSTLIKLVFDPRLDLATGRVRATQVERDGESVQIYTDGFEGSASGAIWTEVGSKRSLASLTRASGRTVVEVSGTMALNRFVDRGRNADVLVDLVRKTASGKRVVFVSATYRAIGKPGLWQALGPWGIAIFWQLLLLFALGAYMKGKRFGPLIVDRPRRRGGSELLQAMAWTALRGRQRSWAVKMLKEQAERKASARGLYAIGATRAIRDEKLSREAGATLRSAEEAVNSKLSAEDTLKIARQLSEIWDEKIVK